MVVDGSRSMRLDLLFVYHLLERRRWLLFICVCVCVSIVKTRSLSRTLILGRCATVLSESRLMFFALE